MQLTHPVRKVSYPRYAYQVWGYQTITKLLLALEIAGLRWIAAWALASQGRAAVTSGDWHFLYTSWQGLVLVLTGIVALFCSVALDLVAQIAFAGQVVRGEQTSIRRALRTGLVAMRRFLCPKGLLVVLYIALVVPIAGMGVSTSLTERLEIPTFISSVIEATPLYSALYAVVMAILVVAGICGIFCVHAVVLDDLPVGEALRRSYKLMRRHWRGYFLRMLWFGLRLALAQVVFVALVALPVAAAAYLLWSYVSERFWTILGCLLVSLAGTYVSLFTPGLTLLKMAELYEEYMALDEAREVDAVVLATEGVATEPGAREGGTEPVRPLARHMRLGDGGPDVQRSGAPAAHSRLDVGAADEARDAHGTHEVPRADVVAGTRRPSGETKCREVVPELHWHPMRLAVCAEVLVLLACVVLSAAGTVFFDTIFPAEVTTRVIAHRGGGNEGPENTVAGLRAAAELGAWASEIDIQRTADGAYVVNHDKTFRRTTGDRHKPGKLTLAEAQKLRVDGEPVASYEDMLDAAHETGLVLFVELKGKSADEQMAKDAVRIARARGMLDSCVFISLDYALIDYLERIYPEAQTGFLTWASYGDETALNCDYLALEELSADAVAIETAHAQGKQVFVWTANTHDEQHRFLAGRADAIITDEVAQAMEVTAELEARSDFQRIVDAFLVLA